MKSILNLTPTATNSAASGANGNPPLAPIGSRIVACPRCEGDILPRDGNSDWQGCPYCGKRLQARVWPVVRQKISGAPAVSDQATCFFHPDKAFQTCCQRCGRFVCALCDLQLGAEHVCPACFERGQGLTGTQASTAEWRYRDVLYDSITLTVGWVWILFWPSLIAALPAVIFLHVKYRKAPRSYLIPRSGWRFWMAYLGLFWLPVLLLGPILMTMLARRH